LRSWVERFQLVVDLKLVLRRFRVLLEAMRRSRYAPGLCQVSGPRERVRIEVESRFFSRTSFFRIDDVVDPDVLDSR
jgi:hypothetical protein